MSELAVTPPPAILVIDDTPANLGLALAYLSERGFDVGVARSGEAGLECAASAPTDLILLDVMMPGIDGFETCRRLKANSATAEIPVIFMTASIEVDDVVKGFEAGGVDYVTKPIRISELMARINTHLGSHFMRRQLAEHNKQLRNEIRAREQVEADLSATIARLKETQASLVQADKLASLGAMVAGVAHELNTPIGNALMTASALGDEAASLGAQVASGGLRRSDLAAYTERSIGMAALIIRSCTRAADLITSFKQVAVDQTAEHRRTFDLLALVEDNVASVMPSFKGIPWVFEIDVPTGISCNSYPGPLGQVIVNLVQNAVAHAFDGQSSGKITITATSDQQSVVLTFSDDGKGMEPSVLEHIFEPFYTTRLGQGGSGLGLSVSMNLITGVLGGTLQAESELGRGSRFIMRFPLEAPDRRFQVRRRPSEGAGD